jgi:hypothetical protein
LLNSPRQQRDIAALEVKIYNAEKNADKCTVIDRANKRETIDDLRRELQGLPGYVKKVPPPEKTIPSSVPTIKPETTENQPRQRKTFSWTSRKAGP